MRNNSTLKPRALLWLPWVSNYEDKPRNTMLRKKVTKIEPIEPSSECFKHFNYTEEFVCGYETTNVPCYVCPIILIEINSTPN